MFSQCYYSINVNSFHLQPSGFCVCLFFFTRTFDGMNGLVVKEYQFLLYTSEVFEVSLAEKDSDFIHSLPVILKFSLDIILLRPRR